MSCSTPPLSPEISYGPNVAVLTWMDDFLIGGNTEVIKAEISTSFNTGDLGTPRHYIGLQTFWYDQDQIMINLESYHWRGLEDTSMAECKAVFTPIDAKNWLLARDPYEEATPRSITQNQEWVGHYH